MAPDPRHTGTAHYSQLVLAHVIQNLVHDLGPLIDLLRIAQPTRDALDDRLNRTAIVDCQDRNTREHGLERHDPKVLVGGCVDEEFGGLEQAILQRAGDTEKEDDFGVLGYAQGGDDGAEGRMREFKGVGEGDELVVVANVLGDTVVVAA